MEAGNSIYPSNSHTPQHWHAAECNSIICKITQVFQSLQRWISAISAFSSFISRFTYDTFPSSLQWYKHSWLVRTPLCWQRFLPLLSVNSHQFPMNNYWIMTETPELLTASLKLLTFPRIWHIFFKDTNRKFNKILTITNKILILFLNILHTSNNKCQELNKK